MSVVQETTSSGIDPVHVVLIRGLSDGERMLHHVSACIDAAISPVHNTLSNIAVMHILLVSAATLLLGYCIGRVSGPAERRIEYYPENLHALLAGYGRALQEHARIASPDNARYATNGLVALAQTCVTEDDRQRLPTHGMDVSGAGGAGGIADTVKGMTGLFGKE